ncbi:MAG: sialate O-acetylesterase, partial [bacterium]
MMERWWVGDVAAFVVAGGLLWLALGTADAATTTAKLPFLHPLFADHMVLQRDREVPVGGWTKPGAKVTVTLAGKSAIATAGRYGRWEARIGPFPAGGPHTLTVAGKESVTIADVLFGDVWVCSGQSNMQMGIGECLNAKQEIAAANQPRIRLFSVPNRIATTPAPVPVAHWDTCTPATVSHAGWGGFSGVAYFFGRFLHEKLDIPIGLIHASWGGTVAEAWVSRGSLAALPDFKTMLEDFDRNVALAGKGDASFDQKLADWWKKNEPGTTATPGWQAPATDDSAWKEMTLPVKWEEAGLPDFDGVVWFRRKIVLPKTWAGRALTLKLGKIDDRDVTYFDGVQVGALDQWDLDRTYTVPGDAVRGGEIVLAVRVLDTGGAGGLYGPAEDMWISPSTGSGSALAGERVLLTGPWKYQATADLRQTPMPQKMDQNPNIVTVLSNGMIEPLVPFGIKGAIWYQGESNVGRAEQYARLLPALIRDWRGRFQSGEFPFFIVQLANWQKTPPEPPAQDAW